MSWSIKSERRSLKELNYAWISRTIDYCCNYLPLVWSPSNPRIHGIIGPRNH